MISELDDDEILNFLMTSDFEDNYSPSEYKFLLTKYRYFYRLLNGKSNRNNLSNENIIEKLNNDLEIEKQKNNILTNTITENNIIIHQLKTRKLSFMERITGKIKNKENNENIGI